MAGVIIYNKSTNRYVYSVNADLSKLINGGVDVTLTSALPEHVASGYYFGDSNGDVVAGTMPIFDSEYVSPQSSNADSDFVVIQAGHYIERDVKIPACESFTHPEMWIPDCDLWGHQGEMSTIGNGTYDSPQTYAIDGMLQDISNSDLIIVEAHQFSYDNIILPCEPNFIPDNIVKGVTIWGVEGSYEFDMSMLSIVPEHMVPEGYSYMDCERYQKYGTAKIAQDGPVWPTGEHQIIIGESTFVEVDGMNKYGIWIEAEPNFIPENIKKGVYIWGVEGTYEGEGGSSSGSSDEGSSGSGSSGELVFIARDLNYIREAMTYGSELTIWFGAMGMINTCSTGNITAAGIDLNDNAAFCAFLAEVLNSFTGSQSGYTEDTAYNWEYSSTYDTLVCRTMNSSGKQAPVLFSVENENSNSVMSCFFEIEFN